MGKNVFANGNEISAKKDDNKSIVPVGDVCLSPPSPPAGPIPIPYPNTTDASRTTDGSKTVKIGGAEVGLKNKSKYKNSNGDEAATKSLGMGVVSHNIQGPMKHAAWSMDVKLEGKNAIRHMDLTTHNHTNQGNLAVTLNQAAFNAAIPAQMDCAQLDQDVKNTRSNVVPAPAGTTATSGSFTDPSGSTRMRAVTPCIPGRTLTPAERAAAGLSPGRSNREMQKPCGAGKHSQDSRNHTESKMINQIFSAAGWPSTPGGGGGLGTLRMSIDYQGDQGGSNFICAHCRGAICGAIDCGLDIELCEKGNLVTTQEVQDRCATGLGWPK